MKYSRKYQRYLSFLVNASIPLAGMSTDIYLPSLPAISHHFHVSSTQAQLTVTVFFIAMGIAQFIAGPFADAWGRKRLIISALIVQFISILAILWSPNIIWMIAWRFIQGAGAAFMAIPLRAVISDVFEEKELKIQVNYLTISFAVGPIVAPFIGGYLQHYFGWRASFEFIFIYACLVFITVLVSYRETLAKRHPLSLDFLWRNYSNILSHRYFVICTVLSGIVWGYAGLYNVTAPFIIQVTLRKSAILYGHVALAQGVAWFLGNMCNRIVFHWDRQLKLQVALWSMFLIIALMLMLGEMGYFNIYTLVLPFLAIIFLGGFIFPIFVSEGLAVFSKIAGSANAILFGLSWGIYSLFTVVGTQLKFTALTPLAAGFMVVNILMLIIYYTSFRKFVTTRS